MDDLKPPPPTVTKAHCAWIPIRLLSSRHREKVRAHLQRLSVDDRYRRFGFVASDDQINRYVDGLAFDRDELFGIFNRRLHLVAMAHLAYPATGEPGQNLQAEFGVSVVDAYRGRGFGSRLFERATLQARNRHVTSFLIHALSENQVMLRIAAKAGAQIHRDGTDSEAILQLPPDTLATQVEALIEQGAAEIDYQVKWQNKAAHKVIDALTEFGKALGDGAPTPPSG